MKPQTRQTLRQIAFVAKVHAGCTGIIAAFGAFSTASAIGEFFLNWLMMFFTWPLLILSALVSFVIAVVYARVTGQVVTPNPNQKPVQFSDDDFRKPHMGISMTGQITEDGFDRSGRPFGLHDD